MSTIWRSCPHLGAQLQKELLLKVAWVRRMESRGILNYPKRFQSAEGCYSHRAVATRGLRIKVANKQFVGLTTPADVDIYAVDSSVWQCPRDAAVDLSLLAARSAAGRCQLSRPGEARQPLAVQVPVGAPTPLVLTAEGCGQWMPVEYRMCAAELLDGGAALAASTSTAYVNDTFYAQRFTTASEFALPNGCRQGAFFHFQEWKKDWADRGGGGGTPMLGIEPFGEPPRFSAKPRDFKVTADGISLLHRART